MASKHQLSLEVPDTNNSKVFRVFDTSLYAEGLDRKCGVLQITSPGYNEPVAIEVLPYFNLILNACTLGLQTTGCGESSSRLPDGIYVVNYSISPNDKVFVEYNHLRVTQTLNTWYNEICKLDLLCCDPEQDVKEKLLELELIRSFVDAAKVKVEYCNSPEAGMELFIYAQNRLKKFSAGACGPRCRTHK